MFRFYHQYVISIDSDRRQCSDTFAQHEDADEDLHQIIEAIKEQAAIKLDGDGYRDMQLLFTDENIEDIKQIMNYQLDVNAGDKSVKNTFTVSYKSLYFKTKGSLNVSVSKSVQHKVDVHHQTLFSPIDAPSTRKSNKTSRWWHLW